MGPLETYLRGDAIFVAAVVVVIVGADPSAGGAVCAGAPVSVGCGSSFWITVGRVVGVGLETCRYGAAVPVEGCLLSVDWCRCCRGWCWVEGGKKED